MIALGGIAGLALIFLLSMTVLRRVLLPSPLPNSKLTPSGARPWQRFRSMASMHGSLSWHGMQAAVPQGQIVLPAAPYGMEGPGVNGRTMVVGADLSRPAPTLNAGGPFAPETWLNTNVPFSQLAAGSFTNAGPGVDVQIEPPPSMQQHNAQNGRHASALDWHSTPYAAYTQAAGGWSGRTFASRNSLSSPRPNNGNAEGNTGAFRRNSLLPIPDSDLL